MDYEAILFDMDGVIIDTHRSVTRFWQEYAGRYQVHLTQADWDHHIYGCPATHTMDVLFPHLTTEERQSILAHMADYETHLTYTPVSGVVPFLRALNEYGLPTALVTSGQTWKVKAVTGQLGIRDLFTVYVTIEEISKGKPDPECYLRAAQLLQKGRSSALSLKILSAASRRLWLPGLCALAFRRPGRRMRSGKPGLDTWWQIFIQSSCMVNRRA